MYIYGGGGGQHKSGTDLDPLGCIFYDPTPPPPLFPGLAIISNLLVSTFLFFAS